MADIGELIEIIDGSLTRTSMALARDTTFSIRVRVRVISLSPPFTHSLTLIRRAPFAGTVVH
jgi:hypothetical protein